MQTFSLKSPALRAALEAWPHRGCVEAVVREMAAQQYSAKAIREAVLTAGRFVAWALARADEEPLDFSATERFAACRAGAGQLRYGERAALRRLRAALVEAGVVAVPPPSDHPRDLLLQRYETSLRRRGYREKSIASHLWFIRPFVTEFWAEEQGIGGLTSTSVLSYIEHQAGDRRSATTMIMCSRLRVFLRFLQVDGRLEEDLAAAVPSARISRSSSLPAYMPATQVEAVLSGCDRTTVAGRRDYAVLMLLARLGLRAAEVAALSLDDVDWRSGVVRVEGKGGRSAHMPLPEEVGAAIAAYLRGGRPNTSARVIFHRVETPQTPFSSATPVILIARRALRRAGVTEVARRHSHVFRHSLATGMIRAGATLNEIGQVLRHQEPSTARIYAKVDIVALRELSMAWPGGVL